jgi:hypothetical protein
MELRFPSKKWCPWNGESELPRMKNGDTGVLVWWAGLCAVSLLNIFLWLRVAAPILRGRPEAFQKKQLLLSAIYVLGCGFRAALPRADVQRICLYDSWLSSVAVGRSVATVAELCFAAQWAFFLREASRSRPRSFAAIVSFLLVPSLTVAEICSWYAVLTTNFLGHAFEETIWAISAFLFTLSLVTLWKHSVPRLRPILGGAIACGMLYIAFMAWVDVPMYWGRWIADEAAGKSYLALLEGAKDVSSRWIVTYSWEIWRPEMPWITLYFSAAVWGSLAFVHSMKLMRDSG